MPKAVTMLSMYIIISWVHIVLEAGVKKVMSVAFGNKHKFIKGPMSVSCW